MSDDQTSAIRQSYDQLADEYARRIYQELEGKPFDRNLLSRFAKAVGGSGELCDMGCDRQLAAPEIEEVNERDGQGDTLLGRNSAGPLGSTKSKKKIPSWP
jgi:hypothetical protein